MRSPKKNEVLRDVGGIEIDVALPREDRVRSFMSQAGDPYRFRSGGIEVNVCYGGDRTVDEAVAHWLAASDNARSAIPPDLLAS